MAGSSNLGNPGKNRIIITVKGQRFYILDMSAGKSFGPQFISASAPICHFSCFQCCLESQFIHISKHQNFICFIILNNDRNHSVTVQFEITPGNTALECIHGNTQLAPFFFQFHIVKRRAAHILSADSVILIFFQYLHHFFFFHIVGMQKNRKTCLFFDILLNTFKAKNTAGVSLNQFFMIAIFRNHKDADEYFFFPEFFGHFFQNGHITRFGKIQHCFLTACINQLFHIFHTFDIAGTNHGNFRFLYNFLNTSYGFLMFRIIG